MRVWREHMYAHTVLNIPTGNYNRAGGELQMLDVTATYSFILLSRPRKRLLADGMARVRKGSPTCLPNGKSQAAQPFDDTILRARTSSIVYVG